MLKLTSKLVNEFNILIPSYLTLKYHELITLWAEKEKCLSSTRLDDDDFEAEDDEAGAMAVAAPSKLSQGNNAVSCCCR